jgi:integrase
VVGWSIDDTPAHHYSALGGARSVQFTDLAIRNLKAPEKGYAYHWDDTGLGIRVSHTGSKTFCVFIASGRRQTIGRYGTTGLSLADARSEARRIQAQKTLGKIRPLHTAFEDAREAFLAERQNTLRSRTIADYRRLLTKHYPYGRMSLASVTPRDILTRLNRLPRAERHHAFSAGRAFFRFCVSQHYLDRSPMADMEPPRASKPRRRLLSQDEISAVYKAAIEGHSHFHRIIALCILTGQRRGEIARLERSWVQDDRITIPAEVTKNKRLHTLPIGREARLVLETTPHLSDQYYFPAARDRVKGKPATVFNGWGKPKAAFDKECGVTDWTIHDLRRCVSSGMAALGIQQIVVEKLLNHVSGGSQSQIAQVYNVYAYLDEMRDAVHQWEDHLAQLLAAE